MGVGYCSYPCSLPFSHQQIIIGVRTGPISKQFFYMYIHHAVIGANCCGVPACTPVNTAISRKVVGKSARDNPGVGGFKFTVLTEI